MGLRITLSYPFITDLYKVIAKSAVFLFGAGAVLDWGAPRTICAGDKLTLLPEHDSEEIANRVCCLTHLFTATC